MLFNNTKSHNFYYLLRQESQIWQSVVADKELSSLAPEIIQAVIKVCELNCKGKRYVV